MDQRSIHVHRSHAAVFSAIGEKHPVKLLMGCGTMTQMQGNRHDIPRTFPAPGQYSNQFVPLYPVSIAEMRAQLSLLCVSTPSIHTDGNKTPPKHHQRPGSATVPYVFWTYQTPGDMPRDLTSSRSSFVVFQL